MSESSLSSTVPASMQSTGYGAIEPISEGEFNRFRALIYDVAGIAMSPEKKTLVAGRLAKRVAHYSLKNFSQYYRLIQSNKYPEEFQIMVDLLTTNETYFFREPQHFDFLREQLSEYKSSHSLRVWSAACSSGEEVYSLAMLLADIMGQSPWEVHGSDISSKVLQSCRRGIYPLARTGKMPQALLHKYCLKGVRSQEGMFLIDRSLRSRCYFHQINLMEALPDIGLFDVIFIRNVMIYFDNQGKVKVINQLLNHLRPGGLLFVSHSETLHGISNSVTMLKPSIYRKVL
ncbi:MAG: SAM-dependent methyltransferase [Oceanospirillum sp.]|nr:SAM-dependent methyltransferase [Oceanospirillum sp.]